jgi:hypothetical protein
MMVWVTRRQYDSYAQRVFRHSIRVHGKSLDPCAIRRRAPVAEIRDEHLLVPDDWHKLMSEANCTPTVQLRG